MCKVASVRALCLEDLLPYGLCVQLLPLLFVSLEEEVFVLSLKNILNRY